MTCGECGNVTAPGVGFPNHVYCKRFHLHMEKREDASKCRDFIPKPLTNADRIRAMSDEELAELWWERVDCGECPAHKECRLTGQDCKRLALEWLRQEAI